MLFNSYYFLFCFFPLVFIGYYLLMKLKFFETGKILMVASSIYFYGFFKPDYVPIFIISILVNYFLCRMIQTINPTRWKKLLTAFGCLLNLGVLGYFKYTGFLFENLNILLNLQFAIPNIVLPLGISFYTFQQLSFLIDCYRGDRTAYSLTDYALFVTFFPQLIAGPIVLPSEMLPQFADPMRKKINWDNMNQGLFIFSCGLAKKCFIADSLAFIVTQGFDTVTRLTVAEAWIVSLAFTFQLYFDFSGYCDMASGIAKIFNIDLPLNFNSPYQATDFQNFWRRWHMTLGRFMMNYLYIPLGGNRKGTARTFLNLFVVFLFSGLWHGAGWLFLIWGGLHGGGILIHRLWRKAMDKWCSGWKIPKIPAILFTFFFVNIFWIFFRATTLDRAWNIVKSMFDFTYILGTTKAFRRILTNFDIPKNLLFGILIGAAAIAFLLPNSAKWQEIFKKHYRWRILATGVFLFIGISCLSRKSPFLYFNF